jgi:Asp-tRNA(Asn)/Glu-tRNA(Gln) amidotransferase A subunit family amidase
MHLRAGRYRLARLLPGGDELADDILSRSAAEVVALYRSKQVSPVEVVTATLDRIERLDRLYNAFVMVDRVILRA